MKKLLSLIICLTIALTLCACGSEPVAPSTSDDAAVNTPVPTPTPEPPKEPTVEVVSEQIIVDTSLGYTTSTYLAEIKNTSDFPIELSDISFDLESEDGTLIKVVNYVSSSPKIVDAGKSAYICEPAVTIVDTDIDATAATKVNLKFNYQKATMPDMPVEVTSISLTNKMGYPNILGKAKNNGTEDLTFVYISVPLYSPEGVLQTVITTYVDVKAGEEASFDQMAIFADTDVDYSASVLGEVSVYPLF